MSLREHEPEEIARRAIRRPMALARLLALYEAKRAAHPDLARGLTWHGLRRVCERECVRLLPVPIVEEAQLVVFDGDWTILVNTELPPRRHTYFAAHELGHLWCEVDAGEGRRTAIYNFSDYAGDDPREDDAELLATLLCQGPRFAALLRTSLEP